MTPRHARGSRPPSGLLLIALGIAVGILAYLVGDASEGAGSEGAPSGAAAATSSVRAPKSADGGGATATVSEPSPSPSPGRRGSW